MQESNISYICLNISNMLLKVNDSIVSINFDSSNLNSSVNNKILSLCTLGESFIKTHWQIMDQL